METKQVINKIFVHTHQFASFVATTTLSLSLFACADSKGLGANGTGSPTSALETAGKGLKMEKINGINVISKASIESYLNDLKNNAASLAAKSYRTMQESSAVDYAKQSWSEVTNEPLEVMGYRFENLVDWSLALEGQIQEDLSDFSTMGDYLKSGGLNSVNDIQLESIDDSLLAAEEFFAQDPVAWLQENQAGNEKDALALQQEQGDKMLVPAPCPLWPGIPVSNGEARPHLPPTRPFEITSNAEVRGKPPGDPLRSAGTVDPAFQPDLKLLWEPSPCDLIALRDGI